jgi:hypothetical protein
VSVESRALLEPVKALELGRWLIEKTQAAVAEAGRLDKEVLPYLEAAVKASDPWSRVQPPIPAPKPPSTVAELYRRYEKMDAE